jgi:spoIIIJ-associated protein
VEADAVDYSGKTVDDAIAAAEAALGASRTELDVQVIAQGSRGVFGIGAEPARIRARRRRPVAAAPAEPTPAPSVTTSPSFSSETTVSPEPPVDVGEEEEYEEEEAPEEDATITAERAAALPGEAQAVLQRLLDSMGFDTTVSVRSTDNPVVLEVHGEGLGVLIGRRGDNLSALQFVVNLILSRGRRQWPRVVVDVENYRSRREESLRSLADRMAFRVTRTGRAFTLEAMPASDRRIIHLSLRERTEVETYSIGEGPSRRVVIAPLRQQQRVQEPE